MAEKLDLRQFYEDTKITEDHIHLLKLHSQLTDNSEKAFKIATANTAFGMLAHLNITSNEETPFIGSRLFKSGIQEFKDRSAFMYAIENLGIYDNFKLAPMAIIMIQRYRAAFDKYEAMLGIQNPFTKKENDNT